MLRNVLQTDNFKSKKEGKDQKLIHQTLHLTKDTTWESNKITIKHHTQESQEVNPFSTGDHKATTNIKRKNDKHETKITKMIHKRSTALERSVKNILLEGLN